jgi:uncharacterized protein (UPF0333 family)
MSIAMATYVGESSFSNLTKVTEHTKSMLESWTVSNNDEASKTLDFNPVIPHYQDRIRQMNGGSQVSREDYMRYGWLFGTR